MSCRLCNESFDPTPSSEWPEYCNVCCNKVNKAYKNGGTIIDDTLFLINESFKKGASAASIVDAVIGQFTAEQINGAKKAFLDKYGELLGYMDEELASDISKIRKNTRKRKAEFISANDIIEALIMLDSNDFTINVNATKPTEIQVVNPEQTNVKTILARFQEMERRIGLLEEDKAHLKVDCISLKNKIKELESNLITVKDENAKLAQDVKNITSQASSLATHHSPPLVAVSGASGVSVPDEEDEKEEDEVRVGVGSDVTSSSHVSGQTMRQTQTHHNQQNRNNTRRPRVNNDNSNLSAAVVANLVSTGSTVNEAITFATNVTNTYSQIAGRGSIGGQSTWQWPLPNQSRSRPTAKPPNTSRKRLSQIAAYKNGSKGAEDNKLAAAKPDWLSNKTLVVAGIDKSLRSSKQQLEAKITDMTSKYAGYNIKLLYTEILSKERSPWLTIAIELSPDDFDKLYCEEAWEEGLKVREFIGRRFWRLPKRMTKSEIKRSVRHSWAE